MSRRLEAKRDRIPDIQVPDPRPPGFYRLGFRHDVANGVGKPAYAPGHGDGGGAPGGHGDILAPTTLFACAGVETCKTYIDRSGRRGLLLRSNPATHRNH